MCRENSLKRLKDSKGDKQKIGYQRNQKNIRLLEEMAIGHKGRLKPRKTSQIFEAIIV
jgi:hypothetical protein